VEPTPQVQAPPGAGPQHTYLPGTPVGVPTGTGLAPVVSAAIAGVSRLDGPSLASLAATLARCSRLLASVCADVEGRGPGVPAGDTWWRPACVAVREAVGEVAAAVGAVGTHLTPPQPPGSGPTLCPAVQDGAAPAFPVPSSRRGTRDGLVMASAVGLGAALAGVLARGPHAPWCYRPLAVPGRAAGTAVTCAVAGACVVLAIRWCTQRWRGAPCTQLGQWGSASGAQCPSLGTPPPATPCPRPWEGAPGLIPETWVEDVRRAAAAAHRLLHRVKQTEAVVRGACAGERASVSSYQRASVLVCQHASVPAGQGALIAPPLDACALGPAPFVVGVPIPIPPPHPRCPHWPPPPTVPPCRVHGHGLAAPCVQSRGVSVCSPWG
jgi:hypothetical protein